MTPDAAKDASEAYFGAQWAAGPNTAIAWPNVPFTPPAAAQWVKLDWIFGNGAELIKGALGARRHSVTGILQIAVFAPKDTGDGALDVNAEAVRAIFNGLRLQTDIVFGAASGPVTRTEESWRSAVVSVPVQVYETV